MCSMRLRRVPVRASDSKRQAMPFILDKDRFEEWADDGTSNVWKRRGCKCQRLTSCVECSEMDPVPGRFPESQEGAFLGLRYAAGSLRHLRGVRGASTCSYGIITAGRNRTTRRSSARCWSSSTPSQHGRSFLSPADVTDENSCAGDPRLQERGWGEASTGSG